MTRPDEEPASRRSPALWIGAIGAAAAALAGLVGAHDGSVWRLPAALESRVEASLRAAGYQGLEIDMGGQRAKLRGLVEDEAAIGAAQRAALTAAGAGGPWAGGVTAVDVSAVSVGRVEAPYMWSIRRSGQVVVVSGAAPSQAAREAIAATAAAAFPNAVVGDEMRVAGGAPSPHFTRVAREAVRALARLNRGEARIADNQIVFIGDGGQEGVDALARAFAEPPAPFRVRMDVTIDGLDVNHPELQGLNLSTGDAETCAAAFARLMERNVINFESGSAAIDPSSRQLLDSLASVALRCDRFRIEVAGHTDATGAREMNMELSRQRAEAVLAYLASQGVARARLLARGYGPDRPRASNATPEGQAANRRIEFDVSDAGG